MKTKRGFYDFFVQTCGKYPSNIAVRHYDNGAYKCFTYSELYGVCEYISQNLQQLQGNRGLIGLVAERNILIPCVIAASHKCSTSFMFLDPSKEIENVKFTIILTILEEERSASLDLLSRKPDKTITIFDYVISFYDYGPPSGVQSKEILEHSFIAQTSGSTGVPKQIQVPVKCILPNIEDLTKLFKVTPDDIIYFSTPLTFDPSMVEILMAFVNGASLLIAPDKVDVLFPENNSHSVSVWQTTPSKFFQHSNSHIRNKILSAGSRLRILALGGEPLNGVRRLQELKDWDNKTRIFTLYGVTEMSCWATVAELDLSRQVSDREVPLGNCLSETQVIVEPDPSSKHKDRGKIILISKTRRCIILNQTNGDEEVSSLKFVETGDLGEVKNGTIYYRGRKDDIVKRFGHKINLQHVENTAMQCPKVKTCSCIWLPKPMLLVVYFSSETLSSNELSDFLKCKLDEKHWPDKIVRVDNLPTNPHGKISRQILSQMYDTYSNAPPKLDSLRVSLLQEIKTLLSIHVTYDDIKDKDFFSLGGTSFLAVALCNKLALANPHFGKFILPYLMTQNNTIDQILAIAEKEVCLKVAKPAKKCLKRSKSESGNSVQTEGSKKSVQAPKELIEFVTLWSHDTGKCVDASPTLFLTPCNLYVCAGSHSGRVMIVDALSGNVQGTVLMRSRVEASVLCFQQKPALPCGVVGAYDGTVVCFQLEDGEERWRINVGAMVKSKAACCNGLLYLASYDGNIRCIDITTGAIKNTVNIAEQAISADLVVAKQQFIVTGTLSGVCASVHAPTCCVAWRVTLGSPVFASPVLYDAEKYVVFAEVSGEIHCRTVEKGIKIWKYSGAKGNIFSSIYAKELNKLKWQLVFGCHDNKVYSIIVKNFQPSLHWKAQLTSPVYATPTGLNDRMILAASNNGRLCAIDAENGVVLAEHQLPKETFSSPAVYNDYIFIGCRNDNLYALRFVTN